VRAARWTAPARADLASIDDHLAVSDPGFADQVGRAAIEAGQFLAEFPFAGEEVLPDHRRWHVRRTPYILFYRVLADSVEIVRVRHEKQNWRAEPL
jgi:toxin ParE1/3/4